MKKIDNMLDQQLLLVGGLAIKHYTGFRSTADIDLVCNSDMARRIVTTG